MVSIAHRCGTPACALGHYAADKRSPFEIVEHLLTYKDETIYVDGAEVRMHFHINSGEAMDLFSENGCNNAYSPQEAADYIEDFVERRTQEEKELTDKLAEELEDSN